MKSETLMKHASIAASRDTICGGGYVLFTPWNRKMLALLSEVSAEPETLKALMPPAASPMVYMARLQPATDDTFAQIIRADQPISERILARPKGEDIPWTERKFLSCSWSLRAPKRLKLHTRRQMLGRDAYISSKAEMAAKKDPTRHFFVLTLLDPVPDAQMLGDAD